MAKLTLRTPWTKQPQFPINIDPQWLSRGLIFLNLGNGLFWTKTAGWNTAKTLVASPTRRAGKYGLGTAFSLTNRMDAPAITTSVGFRSIVASYKPTTAGGGNLGRVFQDLGGSIANEAVFINTSAICYYVAHGSGTDGQWTAGTAFTAGSWQTFGLTHDQTATGNTPSFYIDGASSGITVNSTTTGTYAATSYTPTIGNRSSDNARGFNGDIGPIAIFDHPTNGLTAAEHRELYENIWQLFAPITRTIWVPAAAGGGTTYTMTPGGTITFTGTVLQRREHVQPISGSIAFSGTSSQLLTRVFSPSGSISFSGTNDLLRTRLFTPSGDITFSGTAPFSQNNTYTLSPGGTITFSGTGEQVRERVQIVTGNITFSGAVELLRTRTMVPTGDITFSGSATETRIRVIAPTGQITFTGTAPLIDPNAVGGVTTWRTLTGMGN